MENTIVEKLKMEARILSVACPCNKKGCKNCKRKKLMWEAAKVIGDLSKHTGMWANVKEKILHLNS